MSRKRAFQPEEILAQAMRNVAMADPQMLAEQTKAMRQRAAMERAWQHVGELLQSNLEQIEREIKQ